MTGRTRGRWSNTINAGETPIVELPASTPANEARLAMAVVAELLDRGVHVRDIVVAARDLTLYEQSLSRAAVRRGITTTVWTQLPVADTDPYGLCRGLCRVCAGDAVSIETLLRPLQAGWVPPPSSMASVSSASSSLSHSGEWPIQSETLHRVAHAAPTATMSIEEWHSWIVASSTGDERLQTYCRWVIGQSPAPSATEATTRLSRVLDWYNEWVLPQVKEHDDPALTGTIRTARAVVRMQEITDRLEHKYADWLAADRVEPSWEAVGTICESFATQRPGRREHANANAIDIIEANNAWGREIPYVVAVGLTDGVWPQELQSVLPAELQNRIRWGEEAESESQDENGGLWRLASRAAWGDVRDYDRFGDVVAAATTGLVVTRHTRTRDGVEKPRSPLLAAVDVDTVSQSAAAGLLRTDRQIPDGLATLLPATDNTATPEDDQ